MSDAPQKSSEHILYPAQMAWFSTAETWSRCRSRVNDSGNKSKGRKCTFPPPPVRFAKLRVSLAEVQLCDLSSRVWRTRRSEPFTLDSAASAPPSPAWWRLWWRWDDTRASHPRSSPRTSPAARRKGCRCAPPPWGTPAPPPPASRWSCRSCGYALLQTSTLRNREAIVGVWIVISMLL